jgi:hypothetical protein
MIQNKTLTYSETLQVQQIKGVELLFFFVTKQNLQLPLVGLRWIK